VIRHTPPGRGHAYRPSLDQRDPVQPEAGQQVTLGVLVSGDAGVPVLDLDINGRITATDTRRLDTADSGLALGDAGGHLAAAAEAGEDTGGLDAWQAVIGPFAADARVRYRFRSADARETSVWFDLPIGSWSPSGGRLASASGAEHLVPETLEWLIVDGKPVRARFALGLSEGEHVVGLGERFHSLDQRGWAVDATVFEQYCDQGVRTYLPVPFAHVAGGAAAVTVLNRGTTPGATQVSCASPVPEF
jgi:hypothetical protein